MIAIGGNIRSWRIWNGSSLPAGPEARDAVGGEDADDEREDACRRPRR